jgi:hypothetical protein
MNNIQTCPVCGVTVSGLVVRFSNGSSGSHARLFARVCQYAKKTGCINTDPEKIGEIKAEDGYGLDPMPKALE